MTAVESATGIVVGGLDYGEADRIVAFLTRERGLLKGIARSAKKSRRRFGPALDLFCKVRVRFVERPGADLARIEGCDLVDARAGLRSDLDRLAAATYAAELCREAARERAASEALFDLLDDFLSALSCEPLDPGGVRSFELRALAALGWRPELWRCTGCGREIPGERPVLFDAGRGGAVCGSCERAARGARLSPGTLQTLRAMLLGERVAFTRAALVESDGPIAAFLEHHLGKRLRSRAFLQTLDSR